VKMYEYLATGIPMVSAAMPEVVRLEDVVRIGWNRDDFLAKIEEAIAEQDINSASKRQAVAKANSWAERIETVAHIISDALQ